MIENSRWQSGQPVSFGMPDSPTWTDFGIPRMSTGWFIGIELNGEQHLPDVLTALPKQEYYRRGRLVVSGVLPCSPPW